MKDRLLQLLATEKLTALKFAEIMEVRPSNISHILSGRNNPNFDFVSRLLLRFPDLNPDWLINGIGEMYRGENQAISSNQGQAIMPEKIDNKSNTQMSTLFSEPSLSTTEIIEPAAEITRDVADSAITDVDSEINDVARINHNDLSFKNLTELTNESSAKTSFEKPVNSPAATPVVDKTPITDNRNDAKLKQILMFYDDNTFEIFTPRK